MGNRRLANWMTGVACVLLAGMSAAQAQPIRFAVAAEPYPPYTEKQANGEWKGFEVDLIHKLCTQMKAECEIKEVAWDGIIPSLLAKKIDVIFSSMSVTEEREKQIAFSRAYYDSLLGVAGPKGSEVEISPAGLKGKLIGVQISTVRTQLRSIRTRRKFGNSSQIASSVCVVMCRAPVWLYEVYVDEAAFEAHTRTAHFLASRPLVEPLIERQEAIEADMLALNPSR